MAIPYRSCDHCNKPAVIHDTRLINGIVHEVHLCQEHAAAHGMEAPEQLPMPSMIGDLIVSKTAIALNLSALEKRSRGPTCSRCGMTYAEYRRGGVLGCANCYAAFANELQETLTHAHGGSTQHVGKVPARVDASRQRAAVLQQLLHELQEAVQTEQYERAAALRDRIKSMRPHLSSPSRGGTA